MVNSNSCGRSFLGQKLPILFPFAHALSNFPHSSVPLLQEEAWFLLDDARTLPCRREDALRVEAYIAFYRKPGHCRSKLFFSTLLMLDMLARRMSRFSSFG